MSVWTHVAGIARIDCLRPMIEPKEMIKDAIDYHFGREIHYEDSDEVWRDFYEHPDSYLPHGSEGSLRIETWENGDPSHAAAFTVSIFGDLRDYEDAQWIIDWFKEKLELKPFADLPIWVRQASMVAHTEGKDAVEYHC